MRGTVLSVITSADPTAANVSAELLCPRPVLSGPVVSTFLF